MANVDYLDAAFKAVEIAVAIGGLGGILYRLGRMTQRFELIGAQQAQEISELKKGVAGMTTILVKLAEQSGRIDRVEDRQLAQGKRLDDISRLVMAKGN